MKGPLAAQELVELSQLISRSLDCPEQVDFERQCTVKFDRFANSSNHFSFQGGKIAKTDREYGMFVDVGYRRGTGPVPELGAIFRPVPELGPRQPRLGTGPKNTNRVTIWGASSVEVG